MQECHSRTTKVSPEKNYHTCTWWYKVVSVLSGTWRLSFIFRQLEQQLLYVGVWIWNAISGEKARQIPRGVRTRRSIFHKTSFVRSSALTFKSQPSGSGGSNKLDHLRSPLSKVPTRPFETRVVHGSWLQLHNWSQKGKYSLHTNVSPFPHPFVTFWYRLFWCHFLWSPNFHLATPTTPLPLTFSERFSRGEIGSWKPRSFLTRPNVNSMRGEDDSALAFNARSTG